MIELGLRGRRYGAWGEITLVEVEVDGLRRSDQRVGDLVGFVDGQTAVHVLFDLNRHQFGVGEVQGRHELGFGFLVHHGMQHRPRSGLVDVGHEGRSRGIEVPAPDEDRLPVSQSGFGRVRDRRDGLLVVAVQCWRVVPELLDDVARVVRTGRI